MIDSLVYYFPRVNQSNVLQKFEISAKKIRQKDPSKKSRASAGQAAGRQNSKFILVTLHRPANVDDPQRLKELIDLLNSIAEKKKVIFPVHPRTKKNIDYQALKHSNNQSLILCDPLGYIDFLALMKNASLVLTDSGGIQEETTYLGIPCVTLRTSTERPITTEIGTNYLVGENLDNAYTICKSILKGEVKKGKIPELWDGKAAERIVKILVAETP